jgi:hypothetical protein
MHLLANEGANIAADLEVGLISTLRACVSLLHVIAEAYRWVRAHNVETAHIASVGIEEEHARITEGSPGGYEMLDSACNSWHSSTEIRTQRNETKDMANDSDKNREPTEYHVVYVEDPYPRWEVQYGKRRMGYQAWDKRVATSAAKELAKADRPSKVIIHDGQGTDGTDI